MSARSSKSSIAVVSSSATAAVASRSNHHIAAAGQKRLTMPSNGDDDDPAALMPPPNLVRLHCVDDQGYYKNVITVPELNEKMRRCEERYYNPDEESKSSTGSTILSSGPNFIPFTSPTRVVHSKKTKKQKHSSSVARFQFGAMMTGVGTGTGLVPLPRSQVLSNKLASPAYARRYSSEYYTIIDGCAAIHRSNDDKKNHNNTISPPRVRVVASENDSVVMTSPDCRRPTNKVNNNNKSSTKSSQFCANVCSPEYRVGSNSNAETAAGLLMNMKGYNSGDGGGSLSSSTSSAATSPDRSVASVSLLLSASTSASPFCSAKKISSPPLSSSSLLSKDHPDSAKSTNTALSIDSLGMTSSMSGMEELEEILLAARNE